MANDQEYTIKYDVVNTQTVHELIKGVNAMVKKGWKPCGGISSNVVMEQPQYLWGIEKITKNPKFKKKEVSDE